MIELLQAGLAEKAANLDVGRIGRLRRRGDPESASMVCLPATTLYALQACHQQRGPGLLGGVSSFSAALEGDRVATTQATTTALCAPDAC